MEESALNSLIDQAQETLSPINPYALYDNIRKNYLHPTLCSGSMPNLEPLKQTSSPHRPYGPKYNFMIEAPSSDEGSDIENSYPSARIVAESIFDSTQISFTKSPETSSPYYLAIGSIERNLTKAHLKNALKSYGIRYPQLTFLELPGEARMENFAILKIKDCHDAHSLYAKLSKDEENGVLGAVVNGIPGSSENLKVRWMNYLVHNPELEWNSVILRGLPKNFSSEVLKKKLKDMALHVEPAKWINNILCTIVSLRSIEDAYTLIKNFQRLRLEGTICIHPYSSVFQTPGNYLQKIVHGSKNYYRSECREEMPVKHKKMSDDISENQYWEDKTTGETAEEGEITDRENDFPDQSEYYTFYEFPGTYWTKDAEYSHDGHKIRTRVSLGK
ncbi:unnamed protein product [Blepharisma stoltei]|uniref:RRM domain-containing protein n=1 Tax=Blepharisma stoltei TaxID=1481888 RepID=A0AAU9JMJ8_9CILI|nr:unnamed protein product [Blepharisma stoltei]